MTDSVQSPAKARTSGFPPGPRSERQVQRSRPASAMSLTTCSYSSVRMAACHAPPRIAAAGTFRSAAIACHEPARRSINTAGTSRTAESRATIVRPAASRSGTDDRIAPNACSSWSWSGRIRLIMDTRDFSPGSRRLCSDKQHDSPTPTTSLSEYELHYPWRRYDLRQLKLEPAHQTPMIRRPNFLSLLAGAILLCGNNDAAAQSASNVLVVINEASRESQTIGDYYIGKRGIPAGNVCRLTAKTDETIQRAEYDQQIQLPISRCISTTGGQDRILYIVLTKGVPMRVEGTGGRDTTVASVDSELTLLYRRMTGLAHPSRGSGPEPVLCGNRRRRRVQAVQPRIARYFPGDAPRWLLGGRCAQVDRSGARARVERPDFVLDGRPSWQDKGNAWLRDAAERSRPPVTTARWSSTTPPKS